MWSILQALEERTEYEQLGPTRWRATYRGFVITSSEGRDPREAQRRMSDMIEVLLAALVRNSHPLPKVDPDAAARASEALMAEVVPARQEGPRPEGPEGAKQTGEGRRHPRRLTGGSGRRQ